MSLRRVQPGDNLSTAGHNRLVDQVNALLRPGSAAQAQYGTAGVTFCGPAETHAALFELSGPITYPDLDGAPSDHFDRDPTPCATARLVWCHQHQPGDADAAGQPVRSYFTRSDDAEQTIWFPLSRRDESGYSLRPPVAGANPRVLCLLNRQSGRWEVIEGPPYYMACWGILDAQLNAADHATVSLWWKGSDSGLNVMAYDWLLTTGTNLPSGTKVKVEFFPQEDAWFVTAAACS
jgi:hypothetical protein